MEPLVKINNLVKRFPIRGGLFGREIAAVHALNDVSLNINKGETLGLVGESGSGKSTLGLLVLRLLEPDQGSILFEGRDLAKLNQRSLRPLRNQMQIVFQDPYASLNPRMTVSQIVEEPLIVHHVGNKQQREERVVELLGLVGLGQKAQNKYPHEFSGGQRQRIGIARSIALNPKFIVADEPVSALDVSVRGEIINLMADLQQKLGLTYLFISHDLTVVAHTSDRIAVMYLGKLMEIFPAHQLYEARHPYTQALISAIPVPDPNVKKQRIRLAGDVPSPLKLPTGCVFHPRCQYAQDICRTQVPRFEAYNDEFQGACHFIKEIDRLEIKE